MIALYAALLAYLVFIYAQLRQFLEVVDSIVWTPLFAFAWPIAKFAPDSWIIWAIDERLEHPTISLIIIIALNLAAISAIARLLIPRGHRGV